MVDTYAPYADHSETCTLCKVLTQDCLTTQSLNMIQLPIKNKGGFYAFVDKQVRMFEHFLSTRCLKVELFRESS